MEPVANRAPVDVDAGASGEIGRVRLQMGSDHFALDSPIERHVYKLALMREGWVIDSNGNLAVHQIHKHGERNQNESYDQSKNEAHLSYGLPRISS